MKRNSLAPVLFITIVISVVVVTDAVAQLYRCTNDDGRTVYSDRKCAEPEKRTVISVSSNVMDSPNSTRDADRHALQVARLKSSAQEAPPSDERHVNRRIDRAHLPRNHEIQLMQQWTGEGDAFVIYPFSGRIVEPKPVGDIAESP